MSNYRNTDRPEVSRQDVTAVVKWFNRTKGFGFVQPTDGSADAFLHISVVEQSGNSDLPEGTKLVCDLSDGRRGPQVAFIHRIEFIPDGPPRPADGGATSVVEGKVKFFNTEKGFGFVTPDDGGKDVFVSARTLQRIGLSMLEPEQRVRMATRIGQKGPMAESVELL
ncbi:MAG: cold-shock protein [Kiloniellales bacterium]